MIGRDLAQAPNGLILPEDVILDRYFRRKPQAIDLFCGCGGMSLGLIQAGFEVPVAVDLSIWPVITYMTNLARWGQCEMHFETDELKEKADRACRKGIDFKALAKGRPIGAFPIAGSGWIANHPDVAGCKHMWIWDVRNLTGDMLLEPLGMKRGEMDMVCGSPPCQGFSHAGQRNVMDPRNSLVFEFARLVCEIHPKTMIFENVPGILSMTTPEGQPVVEALCDVLERGDYAGRKALERMFEAQLGTAIFRSRPKKKKAKKPKPAEAEAVEELPLFGETAA